MNYQQQTLAVMNGVELVVALYDGMIRFLHRAISDVEAGDVKARRESIRRVLEILTYLQARLRMDRGGEPAAALAEFYAAMYALCVRASRDASVPMLEQCIRDVQNVRDAWKQTAGGERAVMETAAQNTTHHEPIMSSPFPGAGLPQTDAEGSRRWSA